MTEFLWGLVAGIPLWGFAGYYLRYKSCRAGRHCSGLYGDSPHDQ